MEQLLHYVWKHRLFPLRQLATTDGQPVEVIDPGLHNRNAGPDFFNAKMKIGGMMWVGNVELHSRSSEWYQHGHDSDKAYDNVVLHVVEQADTEVVTSSGRTLPQMVVEIPENVVANYRQLTAAESRPPCHDTVASMPALRLHSWLSALQMERLEQKTTAIEGLLKTYDGSWDDVFFCTLARSFGFGVNSEAFETWARTIPLMQVGHHRDDIFQVEAFFLGQAGLLSPDSLPRSHRQEAVRDGHFLRLQREYSYLAHKFSLSPMNGHQWRFMRLRPQNFPYIRLSQLAWMYWKQDARLSNVLAAASIDELHRLLRAEATDYWHTHYVFGVETAGNRKQLSKASVGLLILNAVVPTMFAYGRHRHDEKLCDRAFDLLEQLPAEHNHIVRRWEECGVKASHAGDTQALLQLQTRYCDRKDCLRCRIGYEYLKAANPK